MSDRPNIEMPERGTMERANACYAVITFSGDPASEHPDEELCGQAPHLQLIACGPMDFCWRALVDWTDKHPLRMWEDAEVLSRDMTVVRTRRAFAGEPNA